MKRSGRVFGDNFNGEKNTFATPMFRRRRAFVLVPLRSAKIQPTPRQVPSSIAAAAERVALRVAGLSRAGKKKKNPTENLSVSFLCKTKRNSTKRYKTVATKNGFRSRHLT